VNFLAHFQLAWPDELLVAGGLEGDFHRGILRGERPLGFEAGIKLHRAIDAYTDQHPAVTALKSDFPAGLRRYAGILIDLAFDHFLTLHWGRYSELALADFNYQVYRILALHRPLLSPGAQAMADRDNSLVLIKGIINRGCQITSQGLDLYRLC
jgi:acyl carrier protein phosphodiesterase